MIRVWFDPERLEGAERTWWENWRARARRATDTLAERVHRGEPPIFESRVWAELKRWLFRHVFHGKCAYCEGKVTPQSFGDAEHWRPKQAVTVRLDGESITISREGQAHPGYWWLAYEWTNLLPACEECNAGGGKQTQFPVASAHVFDPAEAGDVDALDSAERPLLLHPLRGPDPAEHLSFDDFGHVSATADSELGRSSIDVFALDRADLEADRLEVLQKAEHGFKAAWAAIAERKSTWVEEIDRWCGPHTAYSLAVRQYFMRRLNEAVARLPLQETLPD